MRSLRAALFLILPLGSAAPAPAIDLLAGTARIDITDHDAGPVNDPLFAKALVLKRGDTVAVLVTLDAVAIGEIGPVQNDFLPEVRRQLEEAPGIPPSRIIINASHCHGTVRADVALLTVQAVRQAWHALEPVRAGAGSGHEDRISEHRRLRIKDGREIDMRRAYALPPDAAVEDIGPIDPEIGLLRLDRIDGRPLAVVYQFACHPILGAPGGGNTAGFPGFASALVEEALGPACLALFVQGCGGDVNPVRYKAVTHPPDEEALGHRLGLSVLRAWREIATADAPDFRLHHEILPIPRATDYAERITAIDAEQIRLVRSLRPTDIQFKSWLPLQMQHLLAPDHPSYHIQGYLHDHARGRTDLEHQDAVIRRQLDAYLGNVNVMEELTRLNVNRALLVKNQAKNEASGNAPIPAELTALRVGNFRLVTFPGELTVEIGLRIKQAAPHPHSFVAGYTNGYHYYLPTAAQRRNPGYAQEDCDCLVAPEWQDLFEKRAIQILGEL